VVRRTAITALTATAVILGSTPAEADLPPWMAPSVGVDAWEEASPGLAELFAWSVYAPDIPKGESGNMRKFSSFRAYEKRPQLGSTPVLYDIEPYPSTPKREQKRPRKFMRKFVTLAHERGAPVFLAPAIGIQRTDVKCDAKAKSRWERFLNCKYLKVNADGFLLQSQRLQCWPDLFADFVTQAKNSSASPVLFAELTVIWPQAPCGHSVEVLRAAYDAAAGVPDGWALWRAKPSFYDNMGGEEVVQQRDEIAVEFLRAVSGEES
jgi:hypothetical protein